MSGVALFGFDPGGTGAPALRFLRFPTTIHSAANAPATKSATLPTMAPAMMSVLGLPDSVGGEEGPMGEEVFEATVELWGG
ncbi:hypothetical protein TWF281_004999 [Arthrobotrys megalospora]